MKNRGLLRVDIIKQLYYKNPLSLTELSKLTQKSLPLVTKVVNDLVEEGYVQEQGLGPSTGGRRASLFLLNLEKQRYVVAVATDQFTARMIIYDLANNIIHPVEMMELELSDDQEAVDKLVSFIQKNIEASGLDKKNLLGVGIGMPGFISSEEGANYSNLKTNDGSQLGEYLTGKLNLPVFMENDSRLIANAELYFGAAVGMKDVMVVNIGWGTGLGMIINGQLYRGNSGYAGEFSHIPLSTNTGILCSCGKRGCLEVETSLLVMTQKAKAEIEAGAATSMTELFKDKSRNVGELFLEAARNHDPLAVSILSEAAFHIGKGVATLIHIMNPECIVLSGRGAAAGKILLPPIQQAINEFCIPRIAAQTTVVLSELAADAELLASASLVIEHSLFE
ncbi:putative NBD/HSP70 family sugar kinase [Pedobacter cryoconitis]|uniref:Putative NBD/HSP70 family sugar kinase n=1 Tax=Pedobacter cryoconitis TaxID=188932 RepID=A0A7W8ZN78_9SPHI|nr:ROK family transcriptional regulator [Pedobacter cryoconitis]MBB5637139.1 putative NBD/HSP70 family sugar kinase [Pedobacter cryoconitis]MBB6273906.1 putative NBD/HSP70 family sugar kinase [Pedobacter cryoconitis]